MWPVQARGCSGEHHIAACMASMKVLKNVQTERLRDNWSVIKEDNRAKCTESMSVDEIILELEIPVLTVVGQIIANNFMQELTL